MGLTSAQTPRPAEAAPDASATRTPPPAAAADPALPAENVLSDGQFVYGPNVGDFNLESYLDAKAPYLSAYADELYGRSEYYSINPKIYLTLLELHAQLISHPDETRIEDALGMGGADLVSQIDEISSVMIGAFYSHLYTYSALPAAQRKLPPLRARNGSKLSIVPQTNAGTYALVAALAQMEDERDLAGFLDARLPNGFRETYVRLFKDDPAAEEIRINVPGQADYLAAPDGLLQLPYPRGQSWTFGGVHDSDGGAGDPTLTDGSSMDFSPGWPNWNDDTSNMWVVAAASGTATKISACSFKISHTDGWETAYYHLENIQRSSGPIDQNDPIGVIANTLEEATCNGGSSTGPHVHFSLKRNGVLVPLNGTPLSGWYVHSGRWSYDDDPNYMWLERCGTKKYAWSWLQSEIPSSGGCSSISSFVGGISVTSDRNVIAVGRPEIGSQVMAYDGFTAGSATMYVPMLFRKAFGGTYNAALYIQNVDPVNAASVTLSYYDTSGNLTCSHPDGIPALSSHGYWMPTECMPDGWVGSVVITADHNVVAVGRPHIGAEITTYNGFASGSTSMYVPMLFRRAFGGTYNAALYVQNTDPSNTANITIQYYDTSGNPICSHGDSITPLASHGYWMPTECMSDGWVGGAVITADHNIVAVGRPHIGSQVTAYDGFTGGTTTAYLPMIYKRANGGVDNTGFYIQDLDPDHASGVTLDFYDRTGALTCSTSDSIPVLSSHGYWTPTIGCLPDGWTGGVVITADHNIVAIGRPHFGIEVFAYDGFAGGNLASYVPMLFFNAFGGSYNAGYYLQNLDPSNEANLTVKYYDVNGALTCTASSTIGPRAARDVWVPDLATTCP